MKRGRLPITALTCFLALLTYSLQSFAQDKAKEKPPTKAGLESKVAEKAAPSKAKPEPQANGTFKFLGSKFAVGKLVKGAPYSATAITESTQTLSDGNQIIRKNEASIYRDSEGRTRIDQRLETIGKWTSNGDAPLMTLINDPVAGVSYSLDLRTRTAHTNVYKQPKPLTPPARNENFNINGKPVNPVEFEAAMKNQKAQEEYVSTLKQKPGPLPQRQIETGQRKTESLGTQMIEGVTAEGTRTTLTIPAGEIGNIQPIDIVDEAWYSAELQVQVMTRHQDPRTGTVLYRLTNLNRGDPDRSLFEVPADYTVNEGPVSPPKAAHKPQK